MPATVGRFSELESHFAEAKRQGFPAFIAGIDASNPLNSTPYVVSLSAFVAQDWGRARRGMVESLAAAVTHLTDAGLGVEALLIGGSFLDPRKKPRDLDCVIFYSRQADLDINLLTWQAGQHSRGLDVRLLPIDIDPVMVLKMAVYFGVLYTRGRDDSPQMRGLVLVDCSAASTP